MWRRLGTLIGIVLILGACSGGGDDADDGASDDPAKFCELYDPAAERPESYIGSPEHVAEIEDVLDAAPGEIRGDVETLRDYIAERVSPDLPDSQLTDSWPADVQESLGRVTQFSLSTCS